MTSFVYFDVGGVVVLDFSGTNKWKELKQELGIPVGMSQQFDDFWEKYKDEVCIDRDVESLLPLLKKQFNIHIPDNYSLLIDGFINRFEKNTSILPVIEKIHSKFKIGLLTNMYPRMFDEMKKRGFFVDVNWNVIIDSSKKKLQKPDSRIFTLAEKEAGISGGEILFVENSQVHIEAAKIIGWQIFLYDSSNPRKASNDLNKLIESQ
ncbi:MAG: HAD family hydrolase [Candidatus Gottesmanbacteria bacterium]|nr:HAD family hydrolase [Candidatus Gottesmanbacteria bacterium]